MSRPRSLVKPKVAVLRIVTNPPGATVYIDRRDLGPRGTSPRLLGLAPGRYKIIVDLAGYLPAESAEIDAQLAHETTIELKLTPKLEGLTGNLVVNADERGALVEVDGRPRLTPDMSIAAGTIASASLKGFRRRASVETSQTRNELDGVLTQARRSPPLRRNGGREEAPSSFSIVRREELRQGYPTTPRATRRGGGSCPKIGRIPTGIRGFGRLGLRNACRSREDNQPNDDWLGSSYVGYDARTDLEDIERIEVIRGPGSVLYGTNAFSGVINLVTRGVEGKSSGEVGVGTSDYGVGRGRARYNLKLGPDAALWMSIAARQSADATFTFPNTPSSDAAGQRARPRRLSGRDAERARYLQSLTAMWFLHSRDKSIPTAEYETAFAIRAFTKRIPRLIEVRFEPELSRGCSSYRART